MRKLLIAMVVMAPVLAAAIVLIPFVRPAATPLRHAEAKTRPSPSRLGHHFGDGARRG